MAHRSTTLVSLSVLVLSSALALALGACSGSGGSARTAALPVVSPAPPSGTITEYGADRGLSVVLDITAGPDNALWFTMEKRIGRITTTGAITQFSTGVTQPVAITAGPDGALWFTQIDPAGPSIGRMTTSGAVTTYRGLSADPVGGGISAGPDGALWFTYLFSPIIGRITTAGTVTEFRNAAAGSQFPGASIVQGPDGAMWFEEGRPDGKRTLARIAKDGTLSQPVAYADISFHADPFEMALGSDGNFWLANGANDPGNPLDPELVRITPAGQATPFDLGAVGSTGGIVSGPDGALWFLGYDNARAVPIMGRMTTSGAFTAHPTTTASGFAPLGPGPLSMAVGSDGGLWYPVYKLNPSQPGSPPAYSVAIARYQP